MLLGATGSPRASHATDVRVTTPVPEFSKSSPEQSNKTLEMMQNFMVKKGIISNTMSEEEIQAFLLRESNGGDEQAPQTAAKRKDAKKKQISSGKNNKEINENESEISEVTIYRKAVRQLNPELDDKIDNLLNKSRLQIREAENKRMSDSSEENMDTSDETIDVGNNNLKYLNSIAEVAVPGTSRDLQFSLQPVPAPPEMQATKLIKESERSQE